MSMSQEKRITKLEAAFKPPDRPWITLIEERSLSWEEIFAKSGHPGKLSDYNTIRINIVEPPKRCNKDDTPAPSEVEEKENDPVSEGPNTPLISQDRHMVRVYENTGDLGWMS